MFLNALLTDIIDTPLELSAQYSHHDGAYLTDHSIYRTIVGSLVYLTIAIATRHAHGLGWLDASGSWVRPSQAFGPHNDGFQGRPTHVIFKTQDSILYM